jgi:putative transposase
MSQSFTQIYVHIVFHTKNNVNLIQPTIEDELYAYIGGILRNNKSVALQIGGTTNHLHILCTLHKTMTLADLAEEVKKSSSKWIKTKGVIYRNFYWQDGYGGFSVSNRYIEVLKRYISNQKEHHKRVSVIDEFKKFLDDYNIPYEDRFL